jgi:small subunit ribosomal protein S4
MAIDRTPVLKRCRQLGIDPAELGYSSKKESIRQPKRRRKESEYGMQLREKQKVKFIYGVLEKQFHGYFNKARKMNGVTGENLMIILESRLDNVVFRLGFARTRKEARQSVRHGHFTGDVVAVGEKFRDLLPIKEALISSERFEVPGWLEVDIEKLSGNVLALPTREQISGDINEQLIVELYSK